MVRRDCTSGQKVYIGSALTGLLMLGFISVFLPAAWRSGAGFYGSPVQVNALRSSREIFHRMTSLCVGKHLPFRQLKTEFQPAFRSCWGFLCGYVLWELVYRRLSCIMLFTVSCRLKDLYCRLRVNLKVLQTLPG